MGKIREELKPCPFCGKEPNVKSFHDGAIYIECICGKAKTPIMSDNKKCYGMWNTRSRDEETKKLRDTLDYIALNSRETNIKIEAGKALGESK